MIEFSQSAKYEDSGVYLQKYIKYISPISMYIKHYFYLLFSWVTSFIFRKHDDNIRNEKKTVEYCLKIQKEKQYAHDEGGGF